MPNALLLRTAHELRTASISTAKVLRELRRLKREPPKEASSAGFAFHGAAQALSDKRSILFFGAEAIKQRHSNVNEYLSIDARIREICRLSIRDFLRRLTRFRRSFKPLDP